MQQARYTITLLLALLVVSCASMGIPTPETFNERLAAGYQTVIGVRTSAADVLRRGQITVKDAEHIQKQADLVRGWLDTARAVYPKDPAAGEAKLQATIAVLSALQTYLQTKSGGAK